MEFRTLKSNEIDCRIGTINEKGLSLLLYQSARAAMDLLDETVGAENWQRKHEVINDNLFCSIGININYNNNKDPYFIWKQDVGVESYTEKEKGQASDSFKRAAVNWGIGRELYTAPFIWIPSGQYNARRSSQSNKFSTYDKFIVTKIQYSGKTIELLEIYNSSTKRVVYRYGESNMQPLPTMEEPKQKKVVKKAAPVQKVEPEPEEENKPINPTDNGYPERPVMLNLAKEKYPEGSKAHAALLECWHIDKLENASTAQLMVIWGKYGNK